MKEGAKSSIAEQSFFQPFLLPGEKVIWVGRPVRPRWVGADIWHWLISTFALLWLLPCGFASILIWQRVTRRGWEAALSHQGPFVALGVFTVLFVGITVWLIRRRVGRLRRTAYVLTDRRALKLDNREKLPASTSLDIVDRFDTHILADGSGDLVFGYANEYVFNDVGGLEWIKKPGLTFEDINDVPRVLSLAQEALAKLGFKPVS
ncbi:hypothetical protein FRZ61_21900 [Hypericibacter adhaerens]|jgi:hypothetical protein|uniref:DUF304 domain-containing protein n=1 Tax=Hypericibacter adhaerens TaxID=2602016 RepID=A0A5J6N123_9PROT|nr:hypothetical protein [Hypericibacter adhaerens]QEX22260.1 hypothetical protein FRZ61_21900 [Hypericibacter adhaerens]HVY52425.1 hypothetical protein [Devosia sp.]